MQFASSAMDLASEDEQKWFAFLLFISWQQQFSVAIFQPDAHNTWQAIATTTMTTTETRAFTVVNENAEKMHDLGCRKKFSSFAGFEARGWVDDVVALWG